VLGADAVIAPSALRARVRPLWPLFVAAGELHGVAPALLAAIADRETRCGKALGADLTGDNGHGRGLMQVDDRSHADWLAAHDWRDPGTNIEHGASIYAAALGFLQGDEPAAVAAYNAGAGHVHRVLARLEAMPGGPTASAKLAALNAITTGGDYVTDVLARRSAILAAPPESHVA